MTAAAKTLRPTIGRDLAVQPRVTRRSTISLVALALELAACQRSWPSSARDVSAPIDPPSSRRGRSDLLPCDNPPNAAIARECRRNRELLRQVNQRVVTPPGDRVDGRSGV